MQKVMNGVKLKDVALANDFEVSGNTCLAVDRRDIDVAEGMLVDQGIDYEGGDDTNEYVKYVEVCVDPDDTGKVEELFETVGINFKVLFDARK